MVDWRQRRLNQWRWQRLWTMEAEDVGEVVGVAVGVGAGAVVGV